MPFGSVYDGHGGQLCSAFVKKKLHVYIREAMNVEALEKAENPDDLIKEALWQAFMRTEEEFLQISRGQNEFSGSCCNCVIAFRDKLYCANLGDSRALLIRVDQWKPSRVKAIAISRDHKAVLEKTRIEKAGGYVDGNRVNGVLAICRSVGDRELKDEQFLKDPSAFRRMLQSSREEAAAAAAGKPSPSSADQKDGKEDSEAKSETPKDKKPKKTSSDVKEDSDSPKEASKPRKDKSSKTTDDSEPVKDSPKASKSGDDAPKDSPKTRKDKMSSGSAAADSSEDGREATPPKSKKRPGDEETNGTAEHNQHADDVDAARRALATSSPAPRRKKDRTTDKKPRVKVMNGTDASESETSSSKKDRDGSPSTSRRDKDSKRKDKSDSKDDKEAKDDDDDIEVEVEDDFNSDEEDAESTPAAGADAAADDKKDGDAATAGSPAPASAVPTTIKRSFSDRLSMKVKKLGSKFFTKSAKVPADQDPSLALRNPNVVVAAEPEIKVFTRTHEDNVIIIGSDGVYDVLSNKLVARTAGKMLRRYGVDSLDMVAQELVDEAHFQGSSDDITVVVLVLHPTATIGGPSTPSTNN